MARPLSTDEAAHRPFVNLEPCYENHLAYQSRRPIAPEQVRRAMVLVAPAHATAGLPTAATVSGAGMTAPSRRPIMLQRRYRCRGSRP